MKSLWNAKEAKKFAHDPLALRVYTSRLLGRESSLVLHGGGNTSVKAAVKNLFGEQEEVLYIKGSGWDLATIEKSGFAPVKLDALKRMAELEQLTDTEMVRAQRAAMTDPNAPNPSVEAILHAIIPFRFVDHTHADAVVAVTNTPNGKGHVRKIYGDRVLIVPYIMPGFLLAREIFKMTKNLRWEQYEGMILLHHGVFTFSDEAKVSYEQMIRLVTKAEQFIKKYARQGTRRQKSLKKISSFKMAEKDVLTLASIRREVSGWKGSAMLARMQAQPKHVHFSNLPRVASLATRGPITPDHVIRTKRIPVILGKNPDQDMEKFARAYRAYFNRFNNGTLTSLDPAPRWAVWPRRGTIVFAATISDAEIVADITDHTVDAIQWAEGMGGWTTLSEKELFEIEYWELEQAKLKKGGQPPVFQGKVVLVTGAASGIGRACVEAFQKKGAAVAALDINPEIRNLFSHKSIRGLVCDVTQSSDIEKALQETILSFGGLDVVVSNAGIFPASETIAELKKETWQRSMDVNLTSHQILLGEAVPFLSKGIEPAVIIIGSKNVPAPGPGVAAYSVAKAGLTQLARVAALELAPLGIRVNVVHPNQVFDTAIWTQEVLEKRARHYGLTVEEYKRGNVLKVEITSRDVAELVCTMAGPAFAKTTGAQVPIDGGNERVI